ncbi:MAG: hypothetical protein SWK76_06005 [Actinomycetota bacterium]|nr:hypothetical protein [Actinomycetota bacterium]
MTKSRPNSNQSWKERLSSEFSYTGMLCFTFFLYAVLALLSLAPDGTVGKLSPMHGAVQSNSYLQSLLDITGVNRATNFQLQIYFMLLLIFMVIAYAWAVFIFRRREDKGLFSILCIAVPLCLLLVIIPPLVSKDVFSNIFYAKIAARYHCNPYIVTPQRFTSDQLMAFVSLNWKNTAIVYGPLHTYFSVFLNLAAGQGITANILVFKGSVAVFHILNTLLVWSILGYSAPGRQRFGTIIYAWNPLALIIGVGGGHNDLMMMTLVLLALFFLVRGMKWPGYIVLCLSVMVKYITFILVVALVVYLLSRKTRNLDRLRDLVLYTAVFALIFFLFFLPFWEGFRTFSSTLRNLQLNNYSSVGGALSYTVSWVLQYILRLSAELAETLGNVMVKLVLLPTFLAALWFIPRRTYSWEGLPNCFFLVTLVYLVTTSYYMPWYFLWILPLISLRPWDRLSRYSLGIGTATMSLGCDLHPY